MSERRTSSEEYATDDWYDQGFDLSENTESDRSISQEFAINRDLLKSEAEQFSSGNVMQKGGIAGSPRVDDSMTISRGGVDKARPRSDSIIVGGNGPLPGGDGKSASREYFFNRQRVSGVESAVLSEGFGADGADDDSEFGTGSRKMREGVRLSREDNRFLASLNRQNASANARPSGSGIPDGYSVFADSERQSAKDAEDRAQDSQGHEGIYEPGPKSILPQFGGEHAIWGSDGSGRGPLRSNQAGSEYIRKQSRTQDEAPGIVATDGSGRGPLRSNQAGSDYMGKQSRVLDEAPGIVATDGSGRAPLRSNQAGSYYLGPKKDAFSLFGGHTGEMLPKKQQSPAQPEFDYGQALSDRRDDLSGAEDHRDFEYRKGRSGVNGFKYTPVQEGYAAGTRTQGDAMSEQMGSNTQETVSAQGNQAIVRSLRRDDGNRPDPTNTNANKDKSLEELAREYPDLSPEDLIKLRRSSNRCHLVTRIPVFDAKSNISIYELKFTSGRVFQINALKSQHVYHVLFGYFIRRGISCFIGRGKMAMVMMPITYDLINYIDRFSVNRLIVRICPEQPVTPSALHLLTSLRRSGMHFAIDMLLLLKKDWNKVVLSIEYVMIDLSGKIKEQLNVFQRLKVKAPWLKSIGYHDVNHEGYALLSQHKIDFLDGQFWNPQLNFNQDVAFFEPAQEQSVMMIEEMFKRNPDYQIFLQFLSRNETVSRNLAVFLYRFRHVSPRQIQSLQDLFKCLIDNSASRSFSVVIAYSLLQLYCKSASISSQLVLQEFFTQSLIRGYFAEYIAKVIADKELEQVAFQAGMFSLLHLYLLREELDVLIDDRYESIVDSIYGSNETLSDIIDCAKALEATDLASVFKFIQKYALPPASVLVSYEKGIMRANELLLVLHLVPFRK